jgi:hypothetical protein
MSNDSSINFENPFHDRPGSKDYHGFEERMKRLKEKQANEIAKVGRTTLLERDSMGRDIISGTDADRDELRYRHDVSGNERQKEFSDKIYMFPESYNALRRELVEHWPELWALVGWRMANRAEEFVEYMNVACDIHVIFDTEKVDFISKTYLGRLQEMRANSFSLSNVVLLEDVKQRIDPGAGITFDRSPTTGSDPYTKESSGLVVPIKGKNHE